MTFTEFIKEKEKLFSINCMPVIKNLKYTEPGTLFQKKLIITNEIHTNVQFRKLCCVLKNLIDNNLPIFLLLPKNGTPVALKRLKHIFVTRNILISTTWQFGQLTNRIISKTLDYKLLVNLIHIVIEPEKNLKAVNEINNINLPVIGISTTKFFCKKLIYNFFFNSTSFNSITKLFYFIKIITCKNK